MRQKLDNSLLVVIVNCSLLKLIEVVSIIVINLLTALPYPEVTVSQMASRTGCHRCFLWIKPMTPNRKHNTEFQSGRSTPPPHLLHVFLSTTLRCNTITAAGNTWPYTPSTSVMATYIFYPRPSPPLHLYPFAIKVCSDDLGLSTLRQKEKKSKKVRRHNHGTRPLERVT